MIIKPTFYFKNIEDIDKNILINNHISCIFIDADNTIRKHHDSKPADYFNDFLCFTKKNNINLIITSNAKYSNISGFANTVNLSFLHLCKKPLPFKINSYIKKQKLNKSSCIIIGDQILTDILCAKLCGIKSVLVDPIQLEKGINFKIRRKIENLFFRRTIQ